MNNPNTEASLSCQAGFPYPPIQAACKNPVYARTMLENQSGIHSEISTISLYFYNHLITAEIGDMAIVFHNLSIVEMHHLEIFGQLALQLGENPKLWSQGKKGKVFWSAGCNQYPTRLDHLLNHAIEHEKKAVETYLKQAGWIKDKNVVENLERIVLDEQLHIEILTNLYAQYC